MLSATRIQEERSGLSVTATLIEDRAPRNPAVLWDFLSTLRSIQAIHPMWIGPEICAPIPDAQLSPARRDAGLSLANATVMPRPGEVALTFQPARGWGGGVAPIFDNGVFYGAGARLFFPIGWQPGSVVARIAHVTSLAAACGRIRRYGACTLLLERDA